MKNSGQWAPTKYVRRNGVLGASRNPRHVSKASRYFVDNLTPCYERAIQSHARGHLLDMGCGNVPFYDVYRNLVSDNVCIDWANTLHSNPYLDHVLDLGESLPFGAASFDTVVLTDVLEHIPEPARVIDEIARLLRPAGKLILGVPFFYWLHEEPHDYYRYTEFALRRFMEISGLQIVQLEAYGGLPEVLVDLGFKGLEYLPGPLGSIVWPVPAFLAMVSKTGPCRRFSRRTREAFPLGYVLVAVKP